MLSDVTIKQGNWWSSPCIQEKQLA